MYIYTNTCTDILIKDTRLVIVPSVETIYSKSADWLG